MQLSITQREPHETPAPWILLPGRNLLQAKEVAIEAADGIDVISSYILIDVVVPNNSPSHAAILRHLYKMF